MIGRMFLGVDTGRSVTTLRKPPRERKKSGFQQRASDSTAPTGVRASLR